MAFYGGGWVKCYPIVIVNYGFHVHGISWGSFGKQALKFE